MSDSRKKYYKYKIKYKNLKIKYDFLNKYNDA